MSDPKHAPMTSCPGGVCLSASWPFSMWDAMWDFGAGVSEWVGAMYLVHVKHAFLSAMAPYVLGACVPLSAGIGAMCISWWRTHTLAISPDHVQVLMSYMRQLQQMTTHPTGGPSFVGAPLTNHHPPMTAAALTSPMHPYSGQQQQQQYIMPGNHNVLAPAHLGQISTFGAPVTPVAPKEPRALYLHDLVDPFPRMHLNSGMPASHLPITTLCLPAPRP